MRDKKNEIYRKMFSIPSNSSYSAFMIINEFYEYYKLVMFSSFWLEKFRVRNQLTMLLCTLRIRTWLETKSNSSYSLIRY